MTNEEMITDLKQFIQATVHQEMAETEARLNSHLDTKLDVMQEAIADTLTNSIEVVDTTKQVNDHEQRLLRLEQRTA